MIAVFLMWLRSLTPAATLPGGDVALAPIWRVLCLPAIIVTAASLIPPAVNLFRPDWLTFRLVSRAFFDFIWLAFLVALLSAGEWLALTRPAGEAATRLAQVNGYIQVSLLITLAAFALNWLWDLYRLFRHLRGRRQAQ
jgi:hypothetical protein